MSRKEIVLIPVDVVEDYLKRLLRSAEFHVNFNEQPFSGEHLICC
jgi:hypothetical protein